MDYEVVLFNKNQTMEYGPRSRKIFIGRFEEAITRKARHFQDPERSLEQHVADSLSHEVLHHVVNKIVGERACEKLDKVVDWNFVYLNQSFIILEAGI